MSNSDSYNIALRRGDKFDLSLTYKSDGSPVNLTGYSAEMVISWPAFRPTDAAPVDAGEINLTSSGGDITITAADGLIAAHMDAPDTLDVPVGAPIVRYQLRIFTTTDDKQTLLAGEVSVLDDVFELVG